jgi:hypothetical protein
MAVFVLTTAVVIAFAAVAFLVGTGFAGLVFATVWSLAAVTLARVAYDAPNRHSLRWAVLGLLLGPFPALWLSWQAAPHALYAVRRVRRHS